MLCRVLNQGSKTRSNVKQPWKKDHYQPFIDFICWGEDYDRYLWKVLIYGISSTLHSLCLQWCLHSTSITNIKWWQGKVGQNPAKYLLWALSWSYNGLTHLSPSLKKVHGCGEPYNGYQLPSHIFGRYIGGISTHPFSSQMKVTFLFVTYR